MIISYLNRKNEIRVAPQVNFKGYVFPIPDLFHQKTIKEEKDPVAFTAQLSEESKKVYTAAAPLVNKECFQRSFNRHVDCSVLVFHAMQGAQLLKKGPFKNEAEKTALQKEFLYAENLAKRNHTDEEIKSFKAEASELIAMRDMRNSLVKTSGTQFAMEPAF